MLKIFLIFSLLFHFRIQACGEGCLQCDVSGSPTCLVCDLLNNYLKNSDGICQTNPDDNCIATNPSGFCMACKGKFFPSSVSAQICVPLTEAKVVPSCLAYDKDENCLLCKDGQYPIDSQCLQPTTFIKNCLHYSGPTSCKACKAGFHLGLDNTRCIPDSDSNCLLRKHNKCRSCKTTHYLISNLNDNFPSAAQIYQILLSPSVYFKNDCFELTARDNCHTYNGSGVCILCNQGYTWNTENDACDAIENTIFCQIGQRPNQSNDDCIPLPDSVENGLIQDCSEYSRKKHTVTCIKCNDDKILTENNCSIARENMDENCTSYNPRQDLCLACMESFTLSPDKKVCLKNDDQCKTYAIGLDFQKLCFLCNFGFYWNHETQACTANSDIPNCQLYERNQNLCKICQIGYELDLSKTACALINDTNCLTFKINGKCKRCNTSSFLSAEEVCSDPDTSDCLFWNSDYSGCLLCKPNSFLNSSNQCESYIENSCEQAGYNKCLKCHTNKYLSENKCLPINDENCSSNYANQDSCQICNSTYYPALQSSSSVSPKPFLCVAQSIPNCQSYVADSNENKCETCEPNFLLLNNGSLCERKETFKEQNCTEISLEEANFLNCTACTDYTYYIGADFRCHLKNIEFCIEYSENYQHQCETCEGSYLNQNGICVPEILNCNTYDIITKACTACTSTFYLSEGVCLVPVKDHCTNFVSGTNNCDVCQAGYYIQEGSCSPQNVTNCQDYEAANSNICTSCNEGYILQNISDGTQECQSPVQGCKIYSNDGDCTQCEQNYRLTSTTCTIHENCKIVDTSNTSCSECNDGYYSVGDVCTQIPTANCKQGDATSCTACETGRSKYKVINKCDLTQVTKMNGCVSYGASGQCASSGNHIFMDGSNSWISYNIAYCSVFQTDTGECIEPKSGYNPAYLNLSQLSEVQNITDCLFEFFEFNGGLRKCAFCANELLVNSDFLSCVSQADCESGEGTSQNTFPHQAAPNIYIPIVKYCRPKSSIPDCYADVESLMDSTNKTCVKCQTDKHLILKTLAANDEDIFLHQFGNKSDDEYYIFERVPEVNSCATVTTPVENCQYYSEEEVCIKCNKEYYLTQTESGRVCVEEDSETKLLMSSKASLNSILARFVSNLECSEKQKRRIYGFEFLDNKFVPALLPGSTTEFQKCVETHDSTVMTNYMSNHSTLQTNDDCLVYGTYLNASSQQIGVCLACFYGRTQKSENWTKGVCEQDCCEHPALEQTNPVRLYANHVFVDYQNPSSQISLKEFDLEKIKKTGEFFEAQNQTNKCAFFDSDQVCLRCPHGHLMQYDKSCLQVDSALDDLSTVSNSTTSWNNFLRFVREEQNYYSKVSERSNRIFMKFIQFPSDFKIMTTTLVHNFESGNKKYLLPESYSYYANLQDCDIYKFQSAFSPADDKLPDIVCALCNTPDTDIIMVENNTCTQTTQTSRVAGCEVYESDHINCKTCKLHHTLDQSANTCTENLPSNVIKIDPAPSINPNRVPTGDQNACSNDECIKFWPKSMDIFVNANLVSYDSVTDTYTVNGCKNQVSMVIQDALEFCAVVIPFCTDMTFDDATHNFKCNQCEPLYFLNQNQCVMRVLATDCLTFEVTLDSCKTCPEYSLLKSGRCIELIPSYCMKPTKTANEDDYTCEYCI